MKDSIFSLALDFNGAWVRVFGLGLSVRVRGTYKPLFSEREGVVPRLDLGPLRFMVLAAIGGGR